MCKVSTICGYRSNSDRPLDLVLRHVDGVLIGQFVVYMLGRGCHAGSPPKDGELARGLAQLSGELDACASCPNVSDLLADRTGLLTRLV
jgi:hypothetical protein